MKSTKNLIVINDKSFSINKVKKTFENTSLEHLDYVFDSFLNFLKEIKDKKSIITRLNSAYNGLCLCLNKNNLSAIKNPEHFYNMKFKLLELKSKYQNDLINEKDKIIEYINPPIENYHVINIHPFTCNKKNYWESPVYLEWKNNFPKKDIDITDKIDFSKKVNIWLQFDHLDKFDVTNLSKTAIDMIISAYKVKDKKADDKLIQLRTCCTNKIVDSYEEGKIYYIIKQAKEN